MVVQVRGDWRPTLGPKQVSVHQLGVQERQHVNNLQLAPGDVVELAHIGYVQIKSVRVGSGMRPAVISVAGDSINILQILRKVPKD